MPMNATIERFLQYLRHERNLSWRTVDLYRRNLAQWQEYVTAGVRDLDLASVTTNDIRAWRVDHVTPGEIPAPGTIQAAQAFASQPAGVAPAAAPIASAPAQPAATQAPVDFTDGDATDDLPF